MSLSEGKGDHLTQYCPICGYDLWGLGEERCPECGTPFDRSELSWVRGRPSAVNPWADMLLAGSLLLGSVTYSMPPSIGWRGWFNIAWLAAMAGLAALWVWLQWKRLSHDRPHWLLWLVPVMMMMVDHPPLQQWGGATIVALLVSGALVVYVVYARPRWSTMFGAILLLVFGAALLILGLLAVASEKEDYTVTVLGWSITNDFAKAVFVACLGTACLTVGAVTATLLGRSSKGERSRRFIQHGDAASFCGAGSEKAQNAGHSEKDGPGSKDE